MKYMLLDETDRAALMQALANMPDYLNDTLGGLDPRAARRPGPDRLFSPVEQCWHLADLESEGFGARIRRLRDEPGPLLPDFDGDRIARERNYRSLSLADGIAAFRSARAGNLAALRALGDDEWRKTGTQEGVGPVGLCDMPSLMAQHDAAHRAEIELWLGSGGRA